MTRELDRCRWALETASGGQTVALVCSGDAGVYGMAGPLLELAVDYPSVEVEVIPASRLPFPAAPCWAHRWAMISV